MKEGDENKPDTPLYNHNILEGFGTGALLDLRVRMAIGFLNTSPIFHGSATETLPALFTGLEWAKGVATLALDLATELMAEAERRGLVQSIDSVGDLPDDLIKQGERTAEYEVLRQLHAQKFGQKQQSGLAAPIGGGFPIAPGGRGGRH